jgi:hypothetical protein
MKLFLVLIGTISLLTSNKCSQNTGVVNTHTPLVQLQTLGCRGFCPTYKLCFYQDGMLEYEGIRNMLKMGMDTVKLSSAELKRLTNAVKEVNLFQYPERIESKVADAPSSTITVFDGATAHEVTGSIDRPAPILTLEALLIDLAEAHGLKLREGVNPYLPPTNQQEILVTFKPDVNPGNFMMQLEKVRLRIVRRTGVENQWIIGYNPDQIKEKQLIDLLKGMDGVLEAGPVKK